MIGPAGIRRIIPHRPPVLLLDEVLDVVPGERLTARSVLTAEGRDRLCVNGRTFSGTDFPATLVLESWAQAGALLACWQTGDGTELLLAGGIDRVRFGVPVRVGSVLEHRVRLVRAVGDAAILAGETHSAGELALEVGKLIVARRPMPAGRCPPVI